MSRRVAVALLIAFLALATLASVVAAVVSSGVGCGGG
jgi:hypothetical protein